MLVSALITMTQTRLQEEDLEGLTILGWFDDAQNRLGVEAGAKFPSFLNPDGTQSNVTEPAFDSRYHELLVIFACARYRESDESIGEAQYLDNMFESRLSKCVTEMYVEPQYQDDENSQQFDIISGQTSVTVTKPTFSRYYSSLQVFINGVETTSYYINGNTITPLQSLVVGDRVSVLWEEAHIYNTPPQLTGGAW